MAAKLIIWTKYDRERESARLDGGGGGIRTPETLSGLTVFKTAGFNRSPTPPFPSLTGKATYFQQPKGGHPYTRKSFPYDHVPNIAIFWFWKYDQAAGHLGCDENNLVNWKRIPVYKEVIWAAQIGRIRNTPALCRHGKIESRSAYAYGGLL
jgi:hypothetical protein